MDRVDTLLHLEPPADSSLEWPLRHALVQCLDPDEVCRAIDLKFDQPYFDRRRLLNRAVKDMQSVVAPCHLALFTQVLEGLDAAPHRKQQSALSTLFVLADAQPSSGRPTLISRTLAFPSISLRRQAYRSLRGSCDAEAVALVEAAWRRWRDPEAFELLVDVMTAEWLKDQTEELEAVDLKGRTLARFAIKVAPIQPDVLDRLFDRSPVSWAYASAKLGQPVSTDRLRVAFQSAESDDDRSLVVWSIGQLRDWDLLLEIHRLPGPTLEQILERGSGDRPV
jgi:hypothetical protein